MIPFGYMAKHVSRKPEWLKAEAVLDIFSVSGCISKDFADYINYWKHNGYWLFDSPEMIHRVAQENSISLLGTSMFYYEAYEKEFDGEVWNLYEPEHSLPTKVLTPLVKQLEGYDVVNFKGRNIPECSPLSCNSLAEKLSTNSHCLLPSFEQSVAYVSNGAFNDSEPGPYRILAVYSVEWP